MKKLISICLMLLLAACAIAQQPPAEKVLRTYDWKDLMAEHPFPDSEIISMNGMQVLKIVKTNNAPLEITLLTITNSPFIKNMHSLSFDIKCENVDYGLKHYTNWAPQTLIVPDVATLHSQYPPLAEGGDENTRVHDYDIVGTSNWKPVSYSIDWFEGKLPNKLDLIFRLPGPGTIYVRPIKIFGVTQSWWSAQQSGLIGGIGGSLIGCLGALIGTLASLGKARRFVLTTTVILIVTGILLVIAGVVAVAMKQPYAVWYPLLLGGTILTFVLSINLYSIKRRYDDAEIRRMTSMDASGR